MTTYTGWHFLADPHEMAHGGGVVPPVGESVSIEGPPILCRHGFHASKGALDVLRNAPGPWLERIRLEGAVILDDEKAVGTRRVSLSAPVDLSRELRLWACDEAERVLPLYEGRHPGDDRPRHAIEFARRFAAGEATREELAAARSAGWVAGWAARVAAWAAWAAAGDAAGAAAGAAAWAAAGAAAGAATRAAWAAAGAAGAAGDAAGAADWNAERARQERELTALFRRATR